MSDEKNNGVILMADQSASWVVGGLRQLDRLALAVNEWVESLGEEECVSVFVFWESTVPAPERWLPSNARLTRIRGVEVPEQFPNGAMVLTTRLFLARKGLADFVETEPTRWSANNAGLSSAERQKRFEHPRQSEGSVPSKWRILQTPGDLSSAETQLLQSTGKSQDGMVSKFLNRPLSRAVTRQLLKYPISPNEWTLSMLVLPLAGIFFLVRGDYWGFVIGAAIFHFYNVFDGCDGEIARSKYLDCEKGRRLDAMCDFVSNLVFVLCLGLGLFRQSNVGSLGRIYLLESLITFLLIGGRLASYAMELAAPDTTKVVSRRQEQIILSTGQRFMGKFLTAFLFQITKRDVAFFAFFVLAIVAKPAWILHLLFVFAVVTVFLALKDIRRSKSAPGV